MEAMCGLPRDALCTPNLSGRSEQSEATARALCELVVPAQSWQSSCFLSTTFLKDNRWPTRCCKSGLLVDAAPGGVPAATCFGTCHRCKWQSGGRLGGFEEKKKPHPAGSGA